MAQNQKMYFEGKDMFMMPNGETYHLGAKKGEVPQRVLTVGSSSRAKRIASFLDPGFTEKHSNRGFSIFSGKYKGTPIAIISIGMGAPMMDFLMRELSFIQPEPLAVVRLGTCGLFNPKLSPGDIVTAGKGSLYNAQDYTYSHGNVVTKTKGSSSFLISGPVPCDQKLNALVKSQLEAAKLTVHDGLNLSAETFYAAQGRRLEEFSDFNEHVVDQFKSLGVDSVEMETHQLFYQAYTRKTQCSVAAAAIGIVHRVEDKVNISAEQLETLENKSGQACLAALAQFSFK